MIFPLRAFAELGKLEICFFYGVVGTGDKRQSPGTSRIEGTSIMRLNETGTLKASHLP